MFKFVDKQRQVLKQFWYFYKVFWFLSAYYLCWAFNSVGEVVCPIRTEQLPDLKKAILWLGFISLGVFSLVRKFPRLEIPVAR